MKRKGEMKLSFGMIFSIFLIIIFIAFAFYVIPKFLGFQNQISVGKFIDEFKSDVEKMWKSTQGSQELEYSLPEKITEVCFNDESKVYFKPLGVGEGFDYMKIEHLDVGTGLCIDSSNGEIKMTIKKDFGEVLVKIE